MISKNKKAQFLILSGMFSILLLIFIYSIETHNTYIVKFQDSNLEENIKFETCKVAYMSNGSQIDPRFTQLTNDVSNYCSQRNNVCILTIQNNTQIPPSGNYSLLNYTHYNFHLDISNSGKNYNSSFNC